MELYFKYLEFRFLLCSLLQYIYPMLLLNAVKVIAK